MTKTICKRLLTILLAIIMVFSVLPIQAFSQDAVADNNKIEDFDTFLYYLIFLEELAGEYAEMTVGKDPLELVIKYIRTGVDRYNSGSWGIMAGYEDEEFAAFIETLQEENNAVAPPEEQVFLTSLKNISNMYAPNGDYIDIGHMFGTMDITYHNSGSVNHADVGGWGGDLVDLLSQSDRHSTTGTVEEMVDIIAKNYLGKATGESDSFGPTDLYGDLDAYYIMNELSKVEYEPGMLYTLFAEYFTEDLTDEARAEYFLNNRFDNVSLRSDLREKVYAEYLSNKVIAALEGTREFLSEDLTELRKACCYAFADYICKLAGDYVETPENSYFKVFDSEASELAPGITQQIKYATSSDNKQMVYYLATADLTREDVNVYANYNNNDPTKWQMSRVLDQANAAQNKYGNPESEHYIPNYNVIASINGAGFNMGTGQPSGLLVMNGVEYSPINSGGFFAVLKDGTAMIGTKEEYEKYKTQIQEGIAGFGSRLIIDGEICVTPESDYYNKRASRTAIGITKTGKVVFMVLDGRQEPISCGGSIEEIAQIMLEAGCVNAVNLDGGGSSTYVAKEPGEEELKVVSKPSDGGARSVATSLMMVSTAPSSTAFDHAIVEAENTSVTLNTSLKVTATAVSATGNAVDMPEGTYWEVSDTRWGTITKDGIFTGLRNGSVDVKLMLDGVMIGAKTINIVTPDKVYFEKDNIDAVYGSKVDIPAILSYRGKKILYNTDDIVVTLDKPEAGTVDGLTFIGNEASGVKVLNVKVALKSDEEVYDTITIKLFNQGEASFDFDKATGGDRQLAWYRVVSNSVTEDNKNYTSVDTSKTMETSYVFAMDMTQIPIPAHLEDLIYMLPGADSADASAWNFLLQLAERVSVLTEVTPVLNFDKRFDVDYSELKIVNEYFELENTEFNEEENTLKLRLRWIDQTKAIDPATANPLCIVSGIKLTPKADANWGAKKEIAAVHSGEIGYKIYLRASALYTFAQDPENQEIYKLYPFVNPDLPDEKGGYMESIYKEYNDTYTLINALKNGWKNENLGFAYYKDGVKYTGVKEVDGYYYDFGEDGICIGKNKFTGLFYDNSASAYRYAKIGELQTGWHMIDNEWYYFNSNYNAKAGYYKAGVVSFNFEETGRVESGVWAKTLFGTRYYYGPSCYTTGWYVIDGNRYYFEKSYRYEGYRLTKQANDHTLEWYNFGDDGICRDEIIPDGFYNDADKGLCYVVNGKALSGLAKIDGDYYCFSYEGYAQTGTVYARKTNCDLPIGDYTFGADYKAVNGILEKADGLYYYVNGQPKTAGLVKVGDDYYFAGGRGGKVITNEMTYVWESNGYFQNANREFGPDGKMLNGIVEKADGFYYYVNGQPKTAGLVKVGDDYYFAGGRGGKVSVNEVSYTWETNGLLPKANYEFGADGKMLNGIVEKADGIYYYVNGQPRTAGLVKIGDDYYFAGGRGGKVITDCVTYVWEPNGYLPKANYEFGADGKMLDGIVEKADGLYYYVNGQPKTAGLVKIGDDYYFAGGRGGKVITDCVTYVWEPNGYMPKDNYEFGADGKMLDGIVEKADGLYYYVQGKPKTAGLVKVGDDYYFAGGRGGKVITNCVTYVWESNGYMPNANREFGADGKMLDGIVEKADGLYYYVNGQPKMAGLIEIDGNFYFASGGGKLVTNERYYVWEGNGYTIEMNYTFNEKGIIVG